MAGDSIIAGAAAPARRRLIRSAAVLDAVWVVVVSVAMFASSFFALVDLRNLYLSLGDEPYRVYVFVLPVVAAIVAAVAAVRRSVMLAAVATGVLAPATALTGAVAGSLFLADDAAFADVGVAITLGASMLGVVMLLRWFVYHPVAIDRAESRPIVPIAWAAGAAGTLLLVAVWLTALWKDREFSASFIFPTLLVPTTAYAVIGAAVVRTRAAAALAGAGALAQFVAVAAVKFEESEVPWDSEFLLRTGPIGMVLLVVCAALALAAGLVHRFDAPAPDLDADDDAAWRWTAED